MESFIPIPEASELQLENLDSEVQIISMDLSLYAQEFDISKLRFKLTDVGFLFYVPETAVYCIKNGNEIGIHLLPNYSYKKVKLFLLGTCMGILLLQRGVLPLHGSAVSKDGKAYAIIGDSGAGKSTLTANLNNSGFNFLSDDVIAVNFDNDDSLPMIYPSYPQQKLWKDSLNRFDLCSNNLQPILDKEDKFAVPITDTFKSEPLVLSGIFELIKINNKQGVIVREIQNIEKIYRIQLHTYRKIFLKELQLENWHFEMAASLAGKIHFSEIQRSSMEDTLNEISKIICNRINNKEC